MKLDSHPFLVFGSQALALLMIMIGVVGQRAALHSERPRLGERGELWDDSNHAFFARLWEDPFRPLVSDQEKSSLHPATAQEKQPPMQSTLAQATQLKQQVGAGLENITPLEQSNLLLMLSMGGVSNPEAKELRLRSRYA